MTQDKNIFIHNIYYMLSYAFQSLRQDGYRNVSVESFDEIYDLFAMILSKGIATQLKQGLYREYIDQKDDLKVLRGKIDIQQSMRNVSMHRQVLTCEYDELSENVLLNQIIKSTATLLLRSGKVKREYKQSLKKELLYFSNVDLIDPKQIRWSSVRFHRNNQTYYMLIHICRLIIDGMLMTTESGEYKLATFIDEQHMCRLYEKFILEYYRKHYPKLNASASQIPWAVDDDFSKMLPVMQSDIYLQKENDIPDILDRFNNLDKEIDRKRTEQSFLVDKQEIIDNEYDLSINKYKEVVYEKVEYPPTSEILADIEALNREIDKNLAELKALLNDGKEEESE